MKKIFIPLLALVSLAACEARIGGDDAQAGRGEASAEGKSKDGKVSIKAPGVDISVAIPKSIASNVNGEGDLLYPGATMRGLHVDGSGSGGAVELRFTSTDTPERVAAWYRDPARTDYEIGREARDGAAFLFEGTQKNSSSPFKLRLTPKDGGTEGVLSIEERG